MARATSLPLSRPREERQRLTKRGGGEEVGEAAAASKGAAGGAANELQLYDCTRYAVRAIYPYRIFTVIIQAAALAPPVLAAAAALRLAPVEGACAEARPLRVCSELLA